MLHWIAVHIGVTNASGPWYLWWSGIEGDITQLFLLGGLVTIVKRHNCHVTGCKSIFTHIDPKVGASACRKHHSLGRLHGTSQRRNDG